VKVFKELFLRSDLSIWQVSGLFWDNLKQIPAPQPSFVMSVTTFVPDTFIAVKVPACRCVEISYCVNS